ncbi:MAG: AbrB/MazE/SpoVT family DNA-binding domain-containing protein [Chloroflexi bacterium]|nr:AbrB/MazE/SpoVT family DNA-binding domain-containing protein [Chloroflexota bacterium]
MSETTPPYGEGIPARITRQGQITVPKVVRDALGAVPGDELVFQQREGEMVVHHRRRRSVLEFAGIAADTAPDPALTPEQLRETIEHEVGQRYERWLADATIGTRSARPPASG